MITPLCRLGCSLSALLLPGIALRAQSYSLQVFDVMPGYTHNIAIGVSAGGLIAGTAATATGDLRAFVFSDGQFITADLPTGFFGSSGSSPNSRGQITGQLVNDDNSRVIAFVQDGNTVDVLRLPNGFRSSAGHAINSSGQVVGVAATESWQRVEAFVYSAGITKLLGMLPGNTDSDAVSINSAGQIVGNSSGGSGPTQAFLYANGAMSALGTFGPYVDTFAKRSMTPGRWSVSPTPPTTLQVRTLTSTIQWEGSLHWSRCQDSRTRRPTRSMRPARW